MPTIEGACHCRNISYELDWPQGLDRIAVRECSCSFCQQHGAVYTSHPDSELRVTVSDRNKVITYRFGHNTADFYLCGGCGCLMFAICPLDGTDYAVINVNNFENVDPDALVASVTNFDEESIDVRLARRRRNWTPKVMFNQN